MKVLLRKVKKEVEPFHRNVSDLEVAGESLRVRLVRQLKELEASFEEIDEGIEISKGEKYLEITQNVVLSDLFLKKLLRHANESKGNTQYGLRSSSTLILTSDLKRHEAPLAIRYFSDSKEKNFEWYYFDVQHDFEISVGVPALVYGEANLKLRFFESYAGVIEHWNDLHHMNSLIARELCAKWARRASLFFPSAMIEKIMLHPFWAKRFNRIAPSAKIHPTAIIEGSVIEDGAEITAHCYIRASIIGRGATVRESSSIKMSTIGPRSYLMTCDLFNSVVEAQSFIVTNVLHNSHVGFGTFVGGGSGFSDFHVNREPINLQLRSGAHQTSSKFLGSATGENCFIGAGLLFKPGLAIPHSSRIFSSDLIQNSPDRPNATFVNHQGQLVQIPQQFLVSKKKDL